MGHGAYACCHHRERALIKTVKGRSKKLLLYMRQSEEMSVKIGDEVAAVKSDDYFNVTAVLTA